MHRGLGRPTGARAVLALGVAVGCFVPVYFAFLADAAPLAWDFRAYRHAARLALAGEPFVGAWAPVGHGRWVYPPVVVTAFLAFADLPVLPAFVIQVGIQTAAAVAAATFTVAAVEHVRGPLAAVDRALVVAFFLASTYAAVVFGQGQVDPAVVLALVLSVAWLHAGRSTAAGVAAGLAAVVKLFPVVVGLYFLRRRAWGAVAAAVVTGVAATLAGVSVFGVDSLRRYVHLVVHERSRLASFAGGADPNHSALTLARPLGALFPDLAPALYPLLALAVLAPVLVVAYRDVATLPDRAAALLATFGVAILVSPGSNAHHLYYLYPPLVVLLYTARPAVRRVLVAGTAVLLCPVQPAVLGETLAAAGVPATARTAVLAFASDVLTAASVPLVGVLVLLAACVHQAAPGRDSPTLGDPVPGD